MAGDQSVTLPSSRPSALIPSLCPSAHASVAPNDREIFPICCGTSAPFPGQSQAASPHSPLTTMTIGVSIYVEHTYVSVIVAVGLYLLMDGFYSTSSHKLCALPAWSVCCGLHKLCVCVCLSPCGIDSSSVSSAS